MSINQEWWYALLLENVWKHQHFYIYHIRFYYKPCISNYLMLTRIISSLFVRFGLFLILFNMFCIIYCCLLFDEEIILGFLLFHIKVFRGKLNREEFIPISVYRLNYYHWLKVFIIRFEHIWAAICCFFAFNCWW